MIVGKTINVWANSNISVKELRATEVSMIYPFSVSPVFTTELRHSGDCAILGIADDGTVYAEELYGDDGWLAQHKIAPDGKVENSVDEAGGTALPVTPLVIPEGAVAPNRVWHTMRLNYAGPRHRGLRGLERVDELVRTLTVADKFAFAKSLPVSIEPQAVIGLAESYVLSEVQVIQPDWFIVCRRIRIAYALGEEQIDRDGLPFDYDTCVLHVAHPFNREEDEIRLTTGLVDDFFGMRLYRPMDCALVNERLYIGDGGDRESGRVSRVHVMTLDRPEPPSPDDLWRKKLYG